ncbi:MAG: flagellar motor switch protein FliN [Acidimicrobiia bacterium]|nr:flagellar motor switch protein FliN [Acidimicrobiia bacterium]
MAIQQSGGAVLDGIEPTEIPAGSVAGAEDSEVAVVGLLEGSERLATLVVRIGPDAAAPAGDAGEGPAAGATAAPHEFQPLEPGVAVSPIRGHALELLNDVEMRVTVELGRTRMKVRDLLALTAGAVIELDRAAGSPVDVLVNGKLIARGEVVVIDEEFGIRISEIVGGGVDGKRMI